MEMTISPTAVIDFVHQPHPAQPGTIVGGLDMRIATLEHMKKYDPEMFYDWWTKAVKAAQYEQ